MIKVGCTVQLKQKMFSSPHAPKFDRLRGKYFRVIKISDSGVIVKNLSDATDFVTLELDQLQLVLPAPQDDNTSGKKISNDDIRRQLGWYMK